MDQIGLLVAWLLAGTGILTGLVCVTVDKQLRSKH